MRVRLKQIDLTNYRTFTNVTLSIHSNIISITGPRDSGKSNFLEALKYVMGCEVPDEMIVPFSRTNERVFVKAVFDSEDGTDISYQRSYDSDNGEIFHYNNEVVTRQLYQSRLKRIGVNSSIPNLDLTGNGADTPEGRTRFIEKFCGNPSYKEKYERSKNEYLDAKKELTNVKQQLDTIDKHLEHENEIKQYKAELLEREKIEKSKECCVYLHNTSEAISRLSSKIFHHQQDNVEIISNDDVNVVNDKIRDVENQMETTGEEIYNNLITLNENKNQRRSLSAPNAIDKFIKQLLPDVRVLTNRLAQLQIQLNGVNQDVVVLPPEQIEEYEQLRELFSERTAFDALKLDFIDEIIQSLSPELNEKLRPPIEMIELFKEEFDVECPTPLVDLEERICDIERKIVDLRERYDGMEIIADDFVVQQQNKAIKIEILINLYPEVIHGLLSTLCEPFDESYRLIATNIMKVCDQVVVVEDFDAIELIIPVATKLTISNIHFIPKTVIFDDRCNLPDNSVPLKNAFRYNQMYDRVFEFLFKNIAVFETAALAKQIANQKPQRYHIISLDGHFYKATNIPFPNSDIKLRLLDQVLTPVHDEQNPFERYERQSENEFERKILLSDIAKNKIMLNELKFLNNIHKLYKKERDYRTRISNLLNTPFSDSELDFNARISQIYRDFIQELVTKKNHLIQLKSDIEQRMGHKKNEIFGDFCSTHNIPNIDDLENDNRLPPAHTDELRNLLNYDISFIERELQTRRRWDGFCVDQNARRTNLTDSIELLQSTIRDLYISRGNQNWFQSWTDLQRELSETSIKRIKCVIKDGRIEILNLCKEINTSNIYTILFMGKAENIPLEFITGKTLNDLPYKYDAFDVSNFEVVLPEAVTASDISRKSFLDVEKLLKKWNPHGVRTVGVNLEQIHNHFIERQGPLIAKLTSVTDLVAKKKSAFTKTCRRFNFNEYLSKLSQYAKEILVSLTGIEITDNMPFSVDGDATDIEQFLQGVRCNYKLNNDVITDKIIAKYAFMLALHKMNPAPFIVIDDVQISHSGLLCRLVNYLKSKLPNTTVFLVVPNSLMSHADQKFAMIRQLIRGTDGVYETTILTMD